MLPKPGLLVAVPFAAVLEVLECVARSRPERSRLERPAEEAWLRALLLIVLALLLGNEGSFDAPTVPDGDARAETLSLFDDLLRAFDVLSEEYCPPAGCGCIRRAGTLGGVWCSNLPRPPGILGIASAGN